MCTDLAQEMFRFLNGVFGHQTVGSVKFKKQEKKNCNKDISSNRRNLVVRKTNRKKEELSTR